MGVQGLVKLLERYAPASITNVAESTLAGSKVAIDVAIWLHAFLCSAAKATCNTEASTTPTASEEAMVLLRLIERITNILCYGIVPVVVFDGVAPIEKRKWAHMRRAKVRNATMGKFNYHIAMQSYAHAKALRPRVLRVTQRMRDETAALLKAVGVPVVMAPSEAEAQCASLVAFAKVHAVVTTDSDAIVFGAARIISDLRCDQDSESESTTVRQISLAVALTELAILPEQLAELAVVLGCDFSDSVRNVGPATALQALKQHGTARRVYEARDGSVKDNFVPEEAVVIFQQPDVLSPSRLPFLDLEWSADLSRERNRITFIKGRLIHNGCPAASVEQTCERLRNLIYATVFAQA